MTHPQNPIRKPSKGLTLEDFAADLALSVLFFREAAHLHYSNPTRSEECYRRAHRIIDRVEIALYGHLSPLPYPKATTIYIDPLDPTQTQTEGK